ncbi:MAG: hypothetical protein ACTSV1_04160 [Alphaproteobacteria bacterium]
MPPRQLTQNIVPLGLSLMQISDQVLEQISQLGNIENQSGGVIKQDAGQSLIDLGFEDSLDW